MTLRVLVLTKYGDLGPSSRVRFMQYFSGLRQQDLECDCKPLLDNQYIQSSYAGRSVSLLYLLRHYFRRLKIVCTGKKYDVIWLEAELFPFIPAWIEKLLYRFCRIPVVVNYDDAIFHRYDLGSNWLKKALLKNKIAAVMRYARTVVVGNAYLERYAHKSGAKHVLRVPTVVDTDLYQPVYSCGKELSQKVRVGWIGTPSTGRFLRAIDSVFKKLALQADIQVCIMGVKEFKLAGVDLEFVSWSAQDEIPFLQSLDIGVMPLDNTPWERGKCGYKLIQYMACGKPVVGTPLEINAEIIENGVNGFWADTEEEWLDALLKLCKDPGLRQKMGQLGHQRVEERYSVEATLPLIFNALSQAAQLK